MEICLCEIILLKKKESAMSALYIGDGAGSEEDNLSSCKRIFCKYDLSKFHFGKKSVFCLIRRSVNV